MKLLLICFAFDTLQYRVLRCAAELAEAVYVLGPASARRLASSRFCTRFIPATSLGASCDLDRSREEIDAVASAHGLTLVVPGDGRAVRLLSQLQPMRARTYPVPDHLTFDLLNDKWRFGELRRSIDIRHPPPRLFHDPGDFALGYRQRGAEATDRHQPTEGCAGARRGVVRQHSPSLCSAGDAPEPDLRRPRVHQPRWRGHFRTDDGRRGSAHQHDGSGTDPTPPFILPRNR